MASAPADHAVWGLISLHFARSEFKNPDEMDPDFLRWLFRVRKRAGVPFRIISDARDPSGDVGAERSAHKKRPCKAVDLQVKNNYERFRIVWAAVLEGCTRIGVYPAHDGGRGSIHLDREESDENPSERIWTGY